MLRSILASSTLRRCMSAAGVVRRPLSPSLQSHVRTATPFLSLIGVRHMGYCTEFEGHISIEPKLNADEISFLNSLAATQRVHRLRGPLYAPADGSGDEVARFDPDVIDRMRPHPDQPSLKCDWTPSDDGTRLAFDDGDNSDHSVEWLEYIIHNLLSPSAWFYLTMRRDEDPRLASFTCDHTLNGEMEAQGEDDSDRWRLIVVDNIVSDVNCPRKPGEEETNDFMHQRRLRRGLMMQRGRSQEFAERRQWEEESHTIRQREERMEALQETKKQVLAEIAELEQQKNDAWKLKQERTGRA